MTLYEFDKAICDCIDLETGEIDEAKLNQLELERDTKIENILLWQKELIAEADAIKQEESILHERRKAKEHKAEVLKQYVQNYLGGAKFETPKVKVSYRKCDSVQLSEDFVEWAETHGHDNLLVYRCEPSKAFVKQAICDGVVLDGKAELVTTNKMYVR